MKKRLTSWIPLIFLHTKKILGQTTFFNQTLIYTHDLPKLDPNYNGVLNFKTIEDTENENYGFIVFSKQPPFKNLTTFYLNKPDPNINTIIHHKSVKWTPPDGLYSSFDTVGDYAVISSREVTAWNFKSISDNNLITWTTPKNLPADIYPLGMKTRTIPETNLFFVGESYRDIAPTNDYLIFLLDVSDQNLKKEFKVDFKENSYLSFEITRRGDFFLATRADAVDGNYFYVYDYTSGFQSSGTPLTSEIINFSVKSKERILFCFSKNTTKNDYWVGMNKKDEVKKLTWGVFPLTVEADYKFSSSTFTSMISIKFTDYVFLGSEDIGGGMIVTTFSNPETSVYASPIGSLKDDGNIYSVQKFEYFDNIKMSIYSLYDSFFGSEYGLYMFLIDKAYFPCFDYFSLECNTYFANKTTSCDASKGGYLRTGNTTCSCIEGYRTGNTCPECKFPAYECDDFGDTGIWKCRVGSYVDPITTKCVNCSLAEGTPVGCPDPVDLGSESLEIDELDGVFEILMNVSLNDSIKDFGNETNSFENNVNITSFLNIEKESVLLGNQSLKILAKYVFFKEENKTVMRVSIKEDLKAKERTKIHINSIPGTIYEQNYAPNSFIIYTKSKSYTIPVVNQALNKIKSSAEKTYTYIWIVIIASLVCGILKKMGLSSFIFLIKYFQILDIVSNFSKINIQYSMGLRIALEFIEELSFPSIPFIENMSVIEDSEDDKFKEIYAYQNYRRGKRGKAVGSNEDLFVFQGSNFFYSLFLIVSFIFVHTLNSLEIKNILIKWVIKAVNWSHFFILGLFFFDLQFLTVNEIAIHDLSFEQPSKFRWSYIVSCLIFIMTLIYSAATYEYLLKVEKNYRISKERIKEIKKENKDKKELPPEKEEQINKFRQVLNQILEKKEKYSSFLLIRFFTEELNERAIQSGALAVLIDNFRFFLIQVLISTFQLSKLPQVFFIFAVNSCYFVAYLTSMTKLKNKKSIYEGTLVMIKCITKEMCVQIFLTGVLAIGIFEKKDYNYKEAKFYQTAEFVIIGSICVAVMGEFLMIPIPIYELIKDGIVFVFCRKKNLAKIENKISLKNFETERQKLEDDGKEEEKNEGEEEQEIVINGVIIDDDILGVDKKEAKMKKKKKSKKKKNGKSKNKNKDNKELGGNKNESGKKSKSKKIKEQIGNWKEDKSKNNRRKRIRKKINMEL